MAETHEKRTESHAYDLISRRAAIEALGGVPEVWTDSESEIAERNQWARDVAAIKAVPSAQSYSEAEIQKMQDLEQAEIQKAYELGKLDAMEEMLHWIPCSERMPESNDEVLVTYTVNGKKHRYVETATWYDGDEGYWSSPWDEYRVPGTKVEVIAWMPLPKPYMGKDGDGNETD